MVQRGAYPAERAATLSGVPISTVHWWARNDILVPSISAERVKLWSYTDLMGLRIIYWLRQPKKHGADKVTIPRTTMPAVRRVLAQLGELDLALWSEDMGPTVCVDRKGELFVMSEPDAEAVHRQRAMRLGDEAFAVTNPFETSEGSRGPDLIRPRPRLRIIPGKLGGSPHVEHTRLESQALGALAVSGLPTAKIYQLYPSVKREAIDDALALERQLEENLPPKLRRAA